MERHRLNVFLSRIRGNRFATALLNRAGTPLLALLALLVAGLASTQLPVVEPLAEVRLTGDQVSAEDASSPLASIAGRGDPWSAALRASGLTAPALSREQQNVASFISGTYQIAVEQTQWFVEHAYRTARELKIDPFLILAVISVESKFNPRAQSPQGAEGLMQVLTRVHADRFSPFGGVAAAFDPLANIRVGTQILSDFLKRAGSLEGALKAYVGASALPSDGGYGAKVMLERERMAAAAAGRSTAADTLAPPAPSGAGDSPATPRGERAVDAASVERAQVGELSASTGTAQGEGVFGTSFAPTRAEGL